MEIALYHRTSKEKAESIIENGFCLPDESGRWGKGIYFATTDNWQISSFGNTVIKVVVDCHEILSRKYKLIARDYNLDLDEPEGYTHMDEFVTRILGYKGIAIDYENNEYEDIEVCIYDKSILLGIQIVSCE
ncbi:hypothetical protein R3O67_29735 [Bacillus cereus]|uniref:hypothetical protein n=1 Tax=Bacillus cereus TaxID=1396 RepID=UPI00307AC952